jgi:hypothetical protein
LAEERKISKVSIPLSHTEHHTMAMIVVEGEGGSSVPSLDNN